MPQINIRVKKEDYDQFLRLQVVASAVMGEKITQPELFKMAINSLQNKIEPDSEEYDKKAKALERALVIFKELRESILF